MKYTYKNEKIEKKIEPCKLKDFLEKEKIASNTVIVVKNGNLMLEEELIENDDSLTILSAVSGG